MQRFIRRVATMLSLISALLGSLLFIRLRRPWNRILIGPKLVANAFAPLLTLLGWSGAVLGALSGAPGAVFSGMFGLLAGLGYTRRTLSDGSRELDEVFGKGWAGRIPAEIQGRMLPTRHGPTPRSASYAPKPLLERDVIFHTLPGERRLLCDVWTPPAGRAHSGLAIVYAHGSGWNLSDKDFGTRPLFRHLANQGHVIVDVAYRLYPEVHMAEMLHDVQHAVAFTRLNAARLGIDPNRIVLGGASAGGQLALLAAYTAGQPASDGGVLLAPDLAGHDLSVRAAFGFYVPSDLEHLYAVGARRSRAVPAPDGRAAPLVTLEPTPGANTPRATGDFLAERAHGAHSPIHNLSWVMDELRRLPQTGSLPNVLGCRLEDDPARYRLFSPIQHVHPGCPPTLLVHGADDSIVPADSSLALAARLKAAGVPQICRIFPQTEHAFAMLTPETSPVNLCALYDLERFLALV